MRSRLGIRSGVRTVFWRRVRSAISVAAAGGALLVVGFLWDAIWCGGAPRRPRTGASRARSSAGSLGNGSAQGRKTCPELDPDLGARTARRSRGELRPGRPGARRIPRFRRRARPASGRGDTHARGAADRKASTRKALNQSGPPRLGARRLLAAAYDEIDDDGPEPPRRSGPSRSSGRLKPDAGFRSSSKLCCTRFASL